MVVKFNLNLDELKNLYFVVDSFACKFRQLRDKEEKGSDEYIRLNNLVREYLNLRDKMFY